jgi:hypothetical protein
MKRLSLFAALVLSAGSVAGFEGPAQAETISCKALKLAIVARVKVAQDALNASQGMENSPLVQGFAEQIKQAASFSTIYQSAGCSTAELQKALDGVYMGR